MEKTTKIKKIKYLLKINDIILSTLIIIIFTSLITGRNFPVSVNIRSYAAYDPVYCPANCRGDRDPCTGTIIDGTGENIYDPVCCGQIRQTGNPFACDWPWRGWCFPDECSTIPPDVPRQRCGGPRSVYCQLCHDHGCYDAVTPPTNTPVPTNSPPTTTAPSSTPRPPTSTPIPSPTFIPGSTCNNVMDCKDTEICIENTCRTLVCPPETANSCFTYAKRIHACTRLNLPDGSRCGVNPGFVCLDGNCVLGVFPTQGTTPVPTQGPTQGISPGSTQGPTQAPFCHKKNQGDANCDGKVDMTDYEIWQDEYDRLIAGTNLGYNANFMCLEANKSTYFVDLVDFEVWRRNTNERLK